MYASEQMTTTETENILSNAKTQSPIITNNIFVDRCTWLAMAVQIELIR